MGNHGTPNQNPEVSKKVTRWQPNDRIPKKDWENPRDPVNLEVPGCNTKQQRMSQNCGAYEARFRAAGLAVALAYPKLESFTEGPKGDPEDPTGEAAAKSQATHPTTRNQGGGPTQKSYSPNPLGGDPTQESYSPNPLR